MKKTLAIILAVAMLLLCCGCGKVLDPSKKIVSSDTSSSEDDKPGVIKMDEGEPTKSAIPLYGDFDVSKLPTAEYGVVPVGTNTAWNASGMIKNGNTDKEAAEYRNRVLNTPNTQDIYSITGTTYYVSARGSDDNNGLSPTTPFQTVKAPIFSSNVLKPGDAVLFERGGLWRLSSQFRCKAGVIYGSYGSGPKPAFYMSPYNFAQKPFWTQSNRQNIWKASVSDSDVGLLVFNHGEIVGVKKTNGLIALEKNGDYYFNRNDDTLYVYYDGGNPGAKFNDIECGLNKTAFAMYRAPGAVLDNLTIKYCGRHGINIANSDNNKITNCEFGFIGGARQDASDNYSVRLGNAIQMWNTVDGHVVDNNWIYQIYDTGITFQGDYSEISNNDKPYGDKPEIRKLNVYRNISYTNNLIEYCSMSFEWWNGDEKFYPSSADPSSYKENGETTRVENFKVTNNISRFAGYGWGAQRLDHTGSHLMCYKHSFPFSKNIDISDNIFDLSYSWMVRWEFNNSLHAKAYDNAGNQIDVPNNSVWPKEWKFKNNTYYQTNARFNEGMWYNSQSKAVDQDSLASAVRAIESSPKLVKWIDYSKVS